MEPMTFTKSELEGMRASLVEYDPAKVLEKVEKMLAEVKE